MHSRYVRILVVVFAVGVSAAKASAGSYTFTPISAPGSTRVIPTGINNSGDIVGDALVPFDPSKPFSTGLQGFLLSGGVSTPVDFPGIPAGNTTPESINNLGQYVGGYFNPSDFTSPGFTFIGGTYQSVDAPGAVDGTIVSGLNSQGVAVVVALIGEDSLSYTLAGGVFTPVVDPDGASTTFATSINDAGDVVGSYADSDGNTHGFLLHNGVFTTIDDPLATGGATGPITITNSGAIVGTYEGSDFIPHGFVYQNGVFTTVDAPLAAHGTIINGGNDLGQLVGNYTDASGKEVGFVATPVAAPEPGSLALVAAAGLTLAARRLRKRV